MKLSKLLLKNNQNTQKLEVINPQKTIKSDKKNNYIPFYEIFDTKNNKKSYIFLSKHVISSKKFKLPKIIFEKINKSRGVALECSPYTDTAKIHNKAINIVYEKIKDKRNKAKSETLPPTFNTLHKEKALTGLSASIVSFAS